MSSHLYVGRAEMLSSELHLCHAFRDLMLLGIVREVIQILKNT